MSLKTACIIQNHRKGEGMAFWVLSCKMRDSQLSRYNLQTEMSIKESINFTSKWHTLDIHNLDKIQGKKKDIIEEPNNPNVEIIIGKQRKAIR